LSGILIILDANNIAHMAKHSMGGLSWKEMETGVIFGFLSMVKTLAKKFNSCQFAFCWDSSRATSLRRKLDSRYKATREVEKTWEEKKLDMISLMQFTQLQSEILPAMGFKNNFSSLGHEADDLIASLAINNRWNGKRSGSKVIVSSDEDLYQLLDYCYIWHPRTKELVTKENFKLLYGIEPRQWIDVKCLAGCPGDNVVGIAGVGEKTAIKYMKGELGKGKTLDRFGEGIGRTMLEMNEPLVKLPFEGTPIYDLVECSYSADVFLKTFDRFGFRSFEREYESWKQIFNLQ